MPRPRKFRYIIHKPDVLYFKPRGISLRELDHVQLTFDEVEAIRLSDLEGVGQIAAAEKMRISQPTLHRILVSARKKIADALVNSKAIKIKGGPYKMAMKRKRLNVINPHVEGDNLGLEKDLYHKYDDLSVHRSSGGQEYVKGENSNERRLQRIDN